MAVKARIDSSPRLLIGYRRQQQLQRLLALAILLVVLVLVLFPVYWMVITSFKPDKEMYVNVPSFWPKEPTLSGYSKLFEQTPFGNQLGSSFLVAGLTTLISLLISSFGAYSLTRLRFPGRDFLSGAVFFVYLVPATLLLIPMYLIVANLGLMDTYASLILAHLTFTVPFATWMLKGYFQTIPVDLEEAALVDGASRVEALMRIVMPLALPGVVASAIFTFTLSWNDFLFALVFIRTAAITTAPVGLAGLIAADVFVWNQLTAGSLIMSVPIVLLYILAQRYVVTGLTAGAVKG